jgi:predicted nucleotidyltransferase
VVLFGSAARGEMRPDSDIDLLVVTDEEHAELETSLAQLQADTAAWTGNDARVLHITTSPVTGAESALVTAAEEGVVIAGDGMWLRRALRQQVDRGA